MAVKKLGTDHEPEAEKRIFSITLLHAVIIAIGSIIFGYNIGYPSPALYSIDAPKDIPSVQRQLFQSLNSGVAVFGPFVFGALVGRTGRRLFVFIDAIASAVGWVLIMLMNKERRFVFGILGRAWGGLTIGAFSSVCPMYIVEIAPKHATGLYGSFHQLGTAVGVVLPWLIGIWLEWQVITAVGLGLAVALAILIWFVPESPAADTSQAGISGPSCGERVAMLGPYWWSLAGCVCLGAFQQLCGTNGILANLTQLFDEAGITAISPKVGSTIAAGCKVISCFVAGPLIHWLGRKVMFVLSSVFCCLFDTLFALGRSNVGIPPNVSIAAVTGFLVFFGLGLAPIPWFLPAELFTVDEIRPIGSGTMSASVWVFTFVVVFVYPVLAGDKGEHAGVVFFIFAGFSAAAAVFGAFFVKEPKRPELVEQPLIGEDTCESGNVTAQQQQGEDAVFYT